MKKYIATIIFFLLSIVYSGAFAQHMVEETAVDRQIRTLDPLGVGITIISMGLVFLSLLVTYIMLNFLSKFVVLRGKVKQVREDKRVEKKQQETMVNEEEEMSGEVNAAIALAIYLNKEEAHDLIDPILTIKRVSKIYSPWSSKIYSMQQVPNKYSKKFKA